MRYPADSKSHENREQGKDQEVLQKSSCYSALKNWKIVCNASIEQLPLKAKIIGSFFKLFHSLLMWASLLYLPFFIEFGLWVKKCNFLNHTFLWILPHYVLSQGHPQHQQQNLQHGNLVSVCQDQRSLGILSWYTREGSDWIISCYVHFSLGK